MYSLAGGSSGDHEYFVPFRASEARLALRLASNDVVIPNVKKVPNGSTQEEPRLFDFPFRLKKSRK